MKANIKIALADDEILIRQGIKSILNAEVNMKVLFDVSNGMELIDQLNSNSELPNIILMDINMPELNGIDATKIIHSNFPNISIIALSSYNNETFIKNMLGMGAVCYVPKNFSPEDLIYRINKVFENGFYYEHSFLKLINENTIESNILAKEYISDREIDVLKLICDQKSSLEIATLLQISPRTVDGHRNNLLLKTKSKNVAGLVVFAIKNNFYLPKNN